MSAPGQTLWGRDTESNSLLVEAARAWTSGVLVLRGEPGIGKTALLQSAVGIADGFRVLRARGRESETEIAFAGLHELFWPVIDRLGDLPDPQRVALAGALAVGPPWAGDPLAVGAATLTLLASAADERPMLVVIDDAHWLDPPSAAVHARGMLWDAAERIVGEDPSRAVEMMVDAWVTDVMTGDLYAAERSATRALALAREVSPELAQVATVAVESTSVFRGARPADGLHPVALPSLDDQPDASPLRAISAQIAAITSWAAAWHLTDSVRGGEELEAGLAAARRRGLLGVVPLLLGYVAWKDFRQSRWAAGIARAVEAVELATETRQDNPRTWALVNLAHIEAGRGDERPCREHASEAVREARRLELGSLEVYVHGLTGLLELGLGDPATALASLRRCAALAETCGLGNPHVVPYEPDLVEALLAADAVSEARAVTERLQERASRVQSRWGLATAARCRGLICEDTGYRREFEAALGLHVDGLSPFDRARTQLCYGERLRRDRRQTDAREQLSAALATFEQIGAATWAERARRDLSATGLRPRSRRDVADRDRLTPRSCVWCLSSPRARWSVRPRRSCFSVPRRSNRT